MENNKWSNELQTLARQAGEIITNGFRSSKTISEKSSAMDIVTEFDTEVEAFLRKKIQQRFPEHSIIGEEEEYKTKGQMGKSFPKQGFVWVIDPIDGTLNFANGIPLLAVSIALYKDGDLFAGVVYNPIMDEMFCAEKGHGATLNGQHIQTARVENIGRALVGVSVARRKKDLELQKLIERVGGMRALGTAAIALAYVAAGRLDAYWEKDLNLWDIAAGILLVQEAGGKVSLLNQIQDLEINGIEILASGSLFDDYFEALKY